MKYALLLLSSSVFLVGCAGVRVSDVQVASGAANPKQIYIRPFDASAAEYTGFRRGGVGERPIRQSLAGREFAEALEEELDKLAPSMIIEEDEAPRSGWLVEGTLDVVNGGCPAGRAMPVFSSVGLGQSHVKIHVRIREIGASGGDDKDASKLGRRGSVIYEFDLVGGSRLTGHRGGLNAPGLGDAEPFDYRNAAERVMIALSTDPHRYGVRSSPVIR
jgi:hypothetical protein